MRPLRRALVVMVLGAAGACVSSEPLPRESGESPASSAGAGAWIAATRATFRARTAPGTPLLPLGASGLAWDRAELELPRTADAPFRLRDRIAGMEISVRLLGTGAAPAVVSDGWVVYRNAAPGLHVMHRPDAGGTEDFFVLDSAPRRPELRLELALSRGVAGLRLVADTLELLDAHGTPRVHMARPWVVDARGDLRPMRVDVEGCAVDRDPAAPWGRAVVDPGAATCTVRLAWDATLVAPLLVDPTWALTSKKSVRGQFHDLAVLGNGRVLMAGAAAVGLYSSACELFDPATSTWSVTGDMSTARYFHAVVATQAGGALAIGGGDGYGDLSSAEVYDPSTGKWTATGSMSTTRSHHRAVALAGGKILAVGYGAEVWNPTTGAWSSTGPMVAPIPIHHTVTVLADGRVLKAAGGNPLNNLPPVVSTAEIYDPGTNTWTATGNLAAPRSMAASARLASGKVLVAGGMDAAKVELKSAELFDPSTGTWSSLPPMSGTRVSPAAIGLPSGNALVVGGLLGAFGSPGAETLALPGATWTFGAMPIGFSQPGAVRLADGRVLVASPENFEAALARVEVPLGKPCVANDECGSGFCVDSVCCDKACSGKCEACTAAGKGSGADGACGLVKAGLDPRSDCTDEGSPKCGFDGACDGAGACRKYSVSSGCAPAPCRLDADCVSGHCVDGVCCDKACTGKCEACSRAVKGFGVDGVCEPWAAGTDPRDRCAVGAPCKADGLCDGAGACRTSAPKGTTCGAASCASGKLTGSLCDGAGTCSVTELVCEPYLCVGGAACGTTCATDAECAATSYCEAGACLAKKKNGEAAVDPRQCSSGFVADSVCCDTACKGLCESCGRTGSVGACVPHVGSPVHGVCPAESSTDPCSAMVCNGVARDACAGRAGPETTCRPAACVSGKEIAPATCTGSGKCPAASVRSCDPFACGDTSCRTECGRNEDCAPGFACDVASKKCISGASCDGDHTVTLLDGSHVDCSPLKCAGSACRKACGSSADCIGGYACDVASGACDPIGGGGSDSGGCVFGAGRGGEGMFGVVLLGAMVTLARRRRRTAAFATVVALAANHGCAPEAEVEDPEARRAVTRLVGLTGPSRSSVTLRPARLTLPDRGDEPFELSDPESGVAVKARLEGAGSAPAARIGENVVYLGARHGGLDVVHRPVAEGTEDWVWLERAPARPRLSYSLSLGDRAVGLRLVSNVLEILDADGTPRLRVRSPFVVGADAVRHEATLSLEGCAFDRDPSAPWGRPVVAPRARDCMMRVDWSGRPVAYPAAVDPDWVTTGAMVTQRGGHGSTTLASGKVLIAGGYTLTGPSLSTAELFDGATKTFAATGSMAAARNTSWILGLAGGDALVTGGEISPPTTQERYKVATGTWVAAAPDSVAGYAVTGFRWIELADGKVLKCGGEENKASALYDPATDVWTSVGPLSTARAEHTLTRLPSGQVLAVGGWTTRTPAPVATSSAEAWDPVSKTWTTVGSLATARHDHSATMLATGKVLVAGGANGPTLLSSAELFDPTTKLFSTTGSLTTWRSDHVVARLGSGNVLVIAGKAMDPDASKATEVYAVAAGKFAPAADWVGSYYVPSLDALPDGGALAIAINKVLVFPAQSAAGVACKSSGDCASGFCVDGVCCNEACDKACQACTAANKTTGADGVCGPEKAGSDRHDGCADDGAACGKNGLCDGAGACQSYPVSTGCAPLACTKNSECSSGFCVDSVCCNRACDGPCEACSKAKGASSDGTCGPVAAGTDPRDRCAADPGFPASCKADGMCDGAGACRALAPSGTTCGPAKCESGTATGALCDGAGVCVSASMKCAPFVCKDAVACATACVTDAECAPDRYCVASACLPRKATGAAATAGRECASGLTADGVCCNTACVAPCEACDGEGTKGTCVPVVGPARHGTCPKPTSGGDPCVAALCDGKQRDKCAALAAGDVGCRASSCIEGEEIASATCNGSGACPAAKSRLCAPYACGPDDRCRIGCTANADCARGASCEEGKCVGGSFCDGQHTVTSPSGSKSDCTPYRCDEAGCRADCRSSLDCVFGYLCDGTTKRCAAAPTAESDESSGCAVSGIGTCGASEGLVGLVLIGLLATVRRRNLSER